MRDLDSMVAADVMRTDLPSIRPSQSAEELEQLLVDKHLTGLPVIEAGRLVGVVSISDVARVQVLTEALDGQIVDELHWDETQADGFRHPKAEEFVGFRERSSKLKVRDLMRTQVVTCQKATPIREVASLLVLNRIHRVIVVEGERPVGIIGSNDIIQLLVQDQPLRPASNTR